MTNTNQILCGEAATTLSTFEAESVDLVVTDPPYLCGYKDRFGRSVANDTSAEDVLPVFDEVHRVMKNDSYCISFYGWNAVADFSAKWREVGFRVVGQIVFAKDYASKNGFLNYRHESAFVLAKGRPAQPSQKIDDVLPWTYTGNKAHPTEKAVRTIEPIVGSFSKPGDVVLDPFLGSGTTAVVAALLGRQYIGVELDAGYCAHAENRLRGVRKHMESVEVAA